QFSWRQFARLQAAPSWFRPNPLPTIAVLGLGANVQLHSTPVAVEVSVTHADHGRSGTHHLAYVEGVCVRQRVQHRARQQAIDDRFAERLSKSSRCRLSPLSGATARFWDNEGGRVA